MLTQCPRPDRRHFVQSMFSRALIALLVVFVLVVGHSAEARQTVRRGAAGPPASAKRVGLLIFNTGDGLLNAHQIAGVEEKAIALALKRRGFVVRILVNRGYADMIADIASFGKAASGAQVALVCFVGPALQASGENYLIPAFYAGPAGSVTPDDSATLNRTAVNLNHIFDALRAAKSRENVLIVDAAPVDSSSRNSLLQDYGLAPVDPATVGSAATIIAFGTTPDQPVSAPADAAAACLFTRKLVAELNTPKNDLESVLLEAGKAVLAVSKGAQNPWIRSNLAGHSDDFQPADNGLGGHPHIPGLDYGASIRPGINNGRPAVVPHDGELHDATSAKFEFPSTKSIVIPEGLKSTSYDVYVTVRVVLVAGGQVRTEVTETSGHPALDEAAMKVCARIRFKPATEDGRPVDDVERFRFHLVNTGKNARVGRQTMSGSTSPW